MPLIKTFSAANPEVVAASPRIIAITPSDASDLPYQIRELRVGSIAGGTALRVTDAAGTVHDFVVVAAGEKFSGFFDKVHATGTTVSALHGWV